MDEQNPRIDRDRTSGSGQEYGTSRERRSGDAGSDYPTARLDDGRSTPPAATGVEYDAAAATHAAPEQRTREIRAEIAQTREELSETVNAIQDRLSPRNIASNAAESVKQAASDTARDIADSDSVQYVRSNPIPTAMVGIGLAGLAWMYFGGRESEYSYSSRRMYERGGRRRSAYDTYDTDEYASAAGSGRVNRSSGYSTSGYSSGSAYGSRTAAGARDFGSGAADAASDLARQARQKTRRAQSRLQQTWNESPLLVGAAAAVVGAMVGMAVPETERENEWLGETRDSMVQDVQETVRETVSKVQDAATTAVGAVTDQGAQQQGGQQQGSAGQQNTSFNQEMRGPGREDFAR